MILRPPVGPHGGDAARVAAALGLDPATMLELSASLNPVAPDVVPVLRSHLDAVRAYPDPTDATRALADVSGVAPSQVLLTNGGSEAITILSRILDGGVHAEPDFASYPRATDGPRWRSNPHSPTGCLVDPRSVPEVTVWDEAYYPMAAGAWGSGIHTSGATVIGSLTKVLACPGLRVGYIVSTDDALLAAARRAQPPWSVGGLVCAALPELLSMVDPVTTTEQIATLRTRLVDTLTPYLPDPNSQLEAARGPWVLVHGVPRLRTALAHEGIVVRDCTSFAMPGTVRIAVPDPAGLDRLSTTLDRLDPDAFSREEPHDHA